MHLHNNNRESYKSKLCSPKYCGPSMTEINPSLSKSNINRYIKIKPTLGIIGYIVNINDATNFDIDFILNNDISRNYKNVISNQYTFQDLGSDFIKNVCTKHSSGLTVNPTQGTTYRCRLRGIGINQKSLNYLQKLNDASIKVRQLVDRSDGWIISNLFDIDVYQRLLVDVYICTQNDIINLRDFLLNLDPTIFYPYLSKSHRLRNLR